MGRAIQQRFQVQGGDVWVVQRLRKPTRHVNPFSFGGGGSGINPDVMSYMTSNLFSFDYMGSAEYEYGTPREAFHELVEERESYEKFEFDLPLSGVEVDSWMKKTEGYSSARKGSVKVYLICKPSQLKEVTEFIAGDAKGKAFLKEPTQFSAAIRTEDSDVIGWMDFRNVFLYFTDEVTRDKAYEALIEG